LGSTVVWLSTPMCAPNIYIYIYIYIYWKISTTIVDIVYELVI